MKLIFERLWEPGKALKKADLIILAGVSADFRLNYGRRWIEEKYKKIVSDYASNDFMLISSFIESIFCISHKELFNDMLIKES